MRRFYDVQVSDFWDIINEVQETVSIGEHVADASPFDVDVADSFLPP